MNRTVKDATVKQYHYADRQQLTAHLELFATAYNYARRLKTLKGFTPHTNTSAESGPKSRNGSRSTRITTLRD